MGRHLANFLLLAAILYGLFLLSGISLLYISFDRHAGFLETKQFVYHIDLWRLSFYAHVFSSPFILLCGLFQFSPRILRKTPQLHRITGYLYLILLVLISGPASFVMALYANGGLGAQVAFVLLSFLWVGCTLLAYRKVLKKDFVSHGKWLLRSYALGLSAITLRLYVFLIAYFNLPLQPKESYVLVSYLSWIPNLIVAEILIRSAYIERLYQKVYRL